jgi:AcrR family transcriptional regulator
VARLSPDARRQEIVDAALHVALRKGLGATTVRDLAAEMGTSSGLIHHYFESMDDVLAAAFQQTAGADLDRTRAAVSACPTGASRVAAFFASYSRVGEGVAFQIWLDAWAEARRRPALGEASRRLNVAWQRLLADAIGQGVAEGTMSCRDPAASAWRILSLLDGLSLQLAAHPGVIGRRRALEWAVAAFEQEVSMASGSLDVSTRRSRARSSGPTGRPRPSATATTAARRAAP